MKSELKKCCSDDRFDAGSSDGRVRSAGDTYASHTGTHCYSEIYCNAATYSYGGDA